MAKFMYERPGSDRLCSDFSQLKFFEEPSRGGNYMADLTLGELKDRGLSKADWKRLLAEEAERLLGRDRRERTLEAEQIHAKGVTICHSSPSHAPWEPEAVA
jgi:hypothetical protein